MTDTLKKPDISQANVCPPLPSGANSIDKLAYWLGIGLGSGLPQWAPGTWGSVGGIIAAIPLLMLGMIPFFIITLLASIVGIWICGHTSKLMNVHDDPHIVWDEWVGIWITLLPINYVGKMVIGTPNSLVFNVAFFIAAFIIFRFFDIIKPFPIDWVDKRVAGGLGIMLDDIIAAVMSVIVIMILALIATYVILNFISPPL